MDAERQPNRGAAAKARAKEQRKEVERRSEKKEQRRKEQQQQQASPDDNGAPTAARAGQQQEAYAAPSASAVCNFFLAGKCNKGDKCRFLHAVVETVPATAPSEADVDGEVAPALKGYDALDEHTWQEVLMRLDDGRSLLAAASTCRELAAAAAADAVWAPLHRALFRGVGGGDCEEGDPEGEHGDETYDEAYGGNGYTTRERVTQSEAALGLWRAAAGPARPPLPLALPGMTAVAMSGGLGVSTDARILISAPPIYIPSAPSPRPLSTL